MSLGTEPSVLMGKPSRIARAPNFSGKTCSGPPAGPFPQLTGTYPDFHNKDCLTKMITSQQDSAKGIAMTDEETVPQDSSVFREFKNQYGKNASQPPESEDAFMQRLIPRVRRMARTQLTNDVRRMFDSNDISSSVMRKVVGCVRSGSLTLESEGQFMSMLSLLTKRTIIDKHDYLSRLVRDQSRTVSVDAAGSGSDCDTTGWDLTQEDGDRKDGKSPRLTPVDEAILAEKTLALNALCETIRNCVGNKRDWEFFRMRFLEEMTWKQIAEAMGIPEGDVDGKKKSPADTARMRMVRLIEKIRPMLKKYEDWLDSRPTP